MTSRDDKPLLNLAPAPLQLPDSCGPRRKEPGRGSVPTAPTIASMMAAFGGLTGGAHATPRTAGGGQHGDGVQGG